MKILEKCSKFPVDASFLRNKAAVLEDTIKWTFCIRWLPHLQMFIIVLILGLLDKSMWFNILSTDTLKILITGCLKYVKQVNITGERENCNRRKQEIVECTVLGKYRVIRNDCRGFNNLSHTIHLK